MVQTHMVKHATFVPGRSFLAGSARSSLLRTYAVRYPSYLSPLRQLYKFGMNPSSSRNFQEWVDRRQSTVSSSTVSSASTGILFSSPATSSGSSSRKQSLQFYDDVVRLELTPSVQISFVKNGQLFKLKYTSIDVCKDSTGALRCLELAGGLGQQAPFIHSFSNTKLPVPHLEHPKAGDDFPLRVSFMDQQTVQTAHTIFMTQLSYKFDHWDGTRPVNYGRPGDYHLLTSPDCVRFQELLLGSKLVFIGGMAEAKSKGRGEECISQNLRILRGYNGRRVMLFFANSQRKELKRYVSIPLNCIAAIKPPKKAGRPATIELNPNFEILSQMRNFTIQFLDDDDCKTFCGMLSHDLMI